MRNELQTVIDAYARKGDADCEHDWKRVGLATNVLYRCTPLFRCQTCPAESVPHPDKLEPFYVDRPE